MTRKLAAPDRQAYLDNYQYVRHYVTATQKTGLDILVNPAAAAVPYQLACPPRDRV